MNVGRKRQKALAHSPRRQTDLAASAWSLHDDVQAPEWSGPVWGSGLIVSAGCGLLSCHTLARSSRPELAAGSFPAATSRPWQPQARQSVKPPVSITWPSQRMCVLETERLSPSPPFSGEGARSSVHSETRSLCQHRAFPRSLQAESGQARNNGRAAFSRKAACPFPVPVLARHPFQAAWSNHCVLRAEDGVRPHNLCLAGWLRGSELNLCHQRAFHADQIHPAVTWEARHSWDEWQYRALAREDTGETQPGPVLLPTLVGAPTSIHLLLHASEETLGLCPQGLFRLHQSIFSRRLVPFTLGALTACPCVLQ